MSLKINLSKSIVTGFYSGLSPKMPGTCGTLAAALILYFSTLLCNALSLPTTYNSLILLLFSVIVGTPCLQYLLNLDLLSNGKDPQEVVIDEFAGYYLSILFFPLTLKNIFLAFIFFRVFDITKPPPIKRVEKLAGAYGVMLDDLVAAIPAAIAVAGINQLIT